MTARLLRHRPMHPGSVQLLLRPRPSRPGKDLQVLCLVMLLSDGIELPMDELLEPLGPDLALVLQRPRLLAPLLPVLLAACHERLLELPGQ